VKGIWIGTAFLLMLTDFGIAVCSAKLVVHVIGLF
jgi:hypothetical protein